ncbi:disintegrin and metalloproteinase domain-containing protein 33 [Procambarus clarkii]|uniref:disintegrin and metalloproteinase domain-containing protein 33 n=1 Tax=Procambarus clarkii TaxID=6728 RepID=UPI0037444332
MIDDCSQLMTAQYKLLHSHIRRRTVKEQTCRAKRKGEMCREARTHCDLPEYCPGQSEYCPDDVLVSDGTACRGGKGHCYQGACGSHEGRCQQVWGPEAFVASSTCYTWINKRGGSDGNCGVSPASKTGLLPCAPQ